MRSFGVHCALIRPTIACSPVAGIAGSGNTHFHQFSIGYLPPISAAAMGLQSIPDFRRIPSQLLRPTILPHSGMISAPTFHNFALVRKNCISCNDFVWNHPSIQLSILSDRSVHYYKTITIPEGTFERGINRHYFCSKTFHITLFQSNC